MHDGKTTFLRENNILANPKRRTNCYPDVLVIREVSGTSLLWYTVNLAAVASLLSDTPARERTVTAEITPIIGVIYHIGKCNFYLVPARDREHLLSLFEGRVQYFTWQIDTAKLSQCISHKTNVI